MTPMLKIKNCDKYLNKYGIEKFMDKLIQIRKDTGFIYKDFERHTIDSLDFFQIQILFDGRNVLYIAQNSANYCTEIYISPPHFISKVVDMLKHDTIKVNNIEFALSDEELQEFVED